MHSIPLGASLAIGRKQDYTEPSHAKKNTIETMKETSLRLGASRRLYGYLFFLMSIPLLVSLGGHPMALGLEALILLWVPTLRKTFIELTPHEIRFRTATGHATIVTIPGEAIATWDCRPYIDPQAGWMSRPLPRLWTQDTEVIRLYDRSGVCLGTLHSLSFDRWKDIKTWFSVRYKQNT